MLAEVAPQPSSYWIDATVNVVASGWLSQPLP